MQSTMDMGNKQFPFLLKSLATRLNLSFSLSGEKSIKTNFN